MEIVRKLYGLTETDRNFSKNIQNLFENDQNC